MTSQINQIGGQTVSVPREAYDIFQNSLGGGREFTDFLEAIADFHNSFRRGLTKFTANSVTGASVTTSSVVADLQTANDGNVFTITEQATTNSGLIIDFTDVAAFTWVKILAAYDGQHSLAIQLYNWVDAAWDDFGGANAFNSATGTIFSNYDFIVTDNLNYIGTGTDAGKVRVQLIHPVNGNAADDWYIDEISLQQ